MVMMMYKSIICWTLACLILTCSCCSSTGIKSVQYQNARSWVHHGHMWWIARSLPYTIQHVLEIFLSCSCNWVKEVGIAILSWFTYSLMCDKWNRNIKSMCCIHHSLLTQPLWVGPKILDWWLVFWLILFLSKLDSNN